MSFCSISKDFSRNGYTLVDNTFIFNYLPKASGSELKVYLMGLLMASNFALAENTMEKMSVALKLTEEGIIKSYQFWEELGLVTISTTLPYTITYLNPKQPAPPKNSYDVKKYSDFVEEVQRLFPHRVLSENEQITFVNIIRDFKMDMGAMLMIMRYCLDIKANNCSSAYIIAVATNWAKEGLITLESVDQRIAILEQNNEDMRQIFLALGIKAAPDLDDRQAFLLWSKDYGYQLDAILVAAKSLKKRGGISRLSKLMEELLAGQARTALEVDAYIKNKESNTDLALTIVKNIGTYYASMEMVVETYIVPWLSKGFTPQALILLSKFCFTRNIKSLDGLANIVDRFYKLGLLNKDGIEIYIDNQVRIDELIKEVLEAAKATSFISNKDRDYYRTFIENWGFSHEAVLVVAESAALKPFPMTYINKILSLLRQSKTYNIEAIEKFLAGYDQFAANSKSTAPDGDYLKRNYSKEELNSVMQRLEDVNLDEVIL